MPILDSTIAAVFVRFVNADEQPIRTSCPSTFAILAVSDECEIGRLDQPL